MYEKVLKKNFENINCHILYLVMESVGHAFECMINKFRLYVENVKVKYTQQTQKDSE